MAELGAIPHPHLPPNPEVLFVGHWRLTTACGLLFSTPSHTKMGPLPMPPV